MRWLAIVGLLLALTGCGLTWDDLPGGPTLAQKTFATEPEAKLAQAIDDDNAKRIDEALAAGANPNAVGKDMVTMLMFAVTRNSPIGVEKLLAAKAEPNPAGFEGRTALHAAVLQSDPRMTDLLLAAGAKVNARTASLNETPLYVSVGSRSPDVIRRLLAAGADPKIVTALEETPLHAAGRINAGNVMITLLDGGVDPRAKNSGGATFQDYYFGFDKDLLNERALADRKAVADWLRAHGVEVNAGA